MKDLCVVHLVRAQNGIDPFKRFLESYGKNPGGIEHDLLVIFKGFDHPQDTEVFRTLLAPFEHKTFEISDNGFDISAYFSAVRRYSGKYRYFCFLNSYSVILDHDWLRKLHGNLSTPGVGLVGATGSWNSNCKNAFAWFRFIATTIWGLPHKKNRTNTTSEIEIGRRPDKARADWEKAISLIKDAWTNFRHIIYFDAFPNYHIRTNCFMISGELMLSLECPPMRTKMDAYRFESGTKGFTKQILGKGKRVLVVGKDGVGYEKEKWKESKTFWQAEQENLLVADNQTVDYQKGTWERRSLLSSLAWGELRHGNGNR